MSNIQAQQKNPACPNCRSTYTVRSGKRRNRFQILQVYQCAECEQRFTPGPGRNRSYPLKCVLEALSTYNLGHSLAETQRILRQRIHIDIPERTSRSWLSAYKVYTTYSRLRAAGRRLFGPDSILQSRTFHHQQVYRFQAHQAKLSLLLDATTHKHLQPISTYLDGIRKAFPDRFFQTTEHRSSKFPANLHPPITRKENHATRVAALVLPTSPSNKKRHETLQRFMLINDSVTIAVEIPVFLTQDDIAYYRRCGFELTFQTPVITGHIDFLQVRNGYAHILDYKPEARKETHAHIQLTIYALALSRRTGLPVKHFKCGWFDEHDYFEFFPLQGVYDPR